MLKSGKDYKRHGSVDTALKGQAQNIGEIYVLSRFNIETNGLISYLPLYMTMFVEWIDSENGTQFEMDKVKGLGRPFETEFETMQKFYKKIR